MSDDALGLPEDVIARVIARRGRLHVYDEIVARRTALVVVDMQNHFVAEGAVSEVPGVRAIVPTINRLAEAVRAAGGHVVWVRAQYRPEVWPLLFEAVAGPERGARIAEDLADGAPGLELWHELARKPEDALVTKCFFSAFIQGSSDLDARLRVMGADTLLIAGTATNVCCESTARDAMMLGYKVIMVADANKAGNEAAHLATLVNVVQTFGDVMTADEVLARL